MLGNAKVSTSTEGVDGAGAGDIADDADGVAAVLVVDLATASEKVHVGNPVAVAMVDAETAQTILEGVHAAFVDRVASTDFDTRMESAIGVPPEVASDGDTEVSALLA